MKRRVCGGREFLVENLLRDLNRVREVSFGRECLGGVQSLARLYASSGKVVAEGLLSWGSQY